MKKKRLMPMCLCLVLALGLVACDEIEDLLPSSGDDETSEVSPTEPGDTEDDSKPTDPEGPSESVPTYSIKIVYPEGDISLEVGKSETIAVSLVTTVDNTDSRVAGTASEVTLYSSDPSVVSVEGLTITALTEGEAVITATWTEHEVTSEGLAVKVTEPVVAPTPDVITYKVEITSPETGDEIEIDTETEVSVNLITITNGEEGEPVAATSSDVTIKESGSSSILTINNSNLSITGTSTGTTSIIATWTEHDVNSEEVSITVVDSTQGGGSENPGGDTEPSEPVISYGIEITSPTGSASIEVDGSLTISVALITTIDGVESRDTTTTTGVELAQSSTDGGEVTINGLTITGKTAGTVTITATWIEHNVTSEGVIVTVTAKQEEEHTYEYTLSINNSSEIEALEYGGTATVAVSLVTTIDEVAGNPVSGTAETVELSSNNDEVLSISGLSVEVIGYGTATLTATWIEHTDAKDSVELTIEEPEPEFESYTYVITFYNSSNESFGTLPEGMELYAAGSFNGSGELQSDNDGNEWYEWGDENVKLTDNGNGTFNLVLDILPRVGLDINIYAHDTSVEDPDTDMWEHYIAYHLITEEDLNNATGTTNLTYTLGLWSDTYSSWEEVFYVEESGVTSCTVTLKIQVTGGSDFETAYGDYNVHCQSDYDNWGGDNGIYGTGSDGHKMTNNGNGTYTYKFDCEPYNGVGTYTLNVYPGNANGIDWDGTIFSSLTITIGSDDSGNISIGADTLISTTSKTSWTDIFPVVENDPTTVNIHIGVKNTNQSGTGSSNNYYVVAGGASTYYSDSSHQLNADSTLSSIVSADKWYTVSGWDKTTDFYFTLHTTSGSYWATAVLPNPDVSTNDPYVFDFWSYYGESSGDRCYGLSLSYCSTTLVGVSDIYVVLSFDFNSTSTSTGGHLSELSYSVTAGYVS